MQTDSPHDQLTTFFSQYSVHAYAAGHVIIPAYSEPAGVYLVRSGHVQQSTLTPEGNEYIANIYKPGSFFPMIWATTGMTNAYFFTAFDDVEVYRASTADVLRFLESHPDVLMDLCRRVYVGIDGLITQATLNAVADVRKKVIATLLMLGKRFGEADGRAITVKLHFTHKHIGQFSGTSRETVTRVINELEKSGMIHLEHKRITLLHPKKLEELLLQPSS